MFPNSLLNKNIVSYLVVSHELLIVFHKEFDGPTSEKLPESQLTPSLDLSMLESRGEATIADLGDYGMCLQEKGAFS